MSDYLVTMNRHFIKCESAGEDPFNYLDFSLIFDYETGRLYAFKDYVAIYNISVTDRPFEGYIKIQDFWDRANVKGNEYSVTEEEIDYYRVFSVINSGTQVYGTQPSSSNDRVYFVKREIIEINNQYKIQISIKYFPYYATHPDLIFSNTFQNQTVPSPYIIDFEETFISSYPQSVKQKKYLRPDGSITSLNSSEIEVIENIAMIFNQVYHESEFISILSNLELLSILNKHFEIINDLDYTVLENELYHQVFNPSFFALFRIRLIDFFYWIKGKGYSNASRIEILGRIIVLFDTEALRYSLSYDDKVDFLNKILIDKAWLTGRWNPFIEKYKLTNEEVIVKIVNIIYKEINEVPNYNEINKFLDLLGNSPKYLESTSVSLYEILYKDIDPDVVFGGGGARQEFVDAVYKLWLNSRYNPKSAYTHSNPYFYHYTDFHASSWCEENNVIVCYPDKSAAPRDIYYKSEKKWLWYNDNMTFSFKENGKILASFDDRGIYSAYGYYEIFQPINLVNISPSGTFVKIPIDPSTLNDYQNPCDIEVEGRGSNLPIFYLKYIDDIGDKQDAEESLMLVIDVGTTLLGGWGIARRLIAEGVFIAIRNATKKAAVDGVAAAIQELAPAVRSNLLRILQSVGVESIELVLGASSILHNIVEGNCTNYNNCNNEPPTEGDSDFEAYQRCQAMQKWLFALEILTLSGDVISRNFFKNATRELNAKLPRGQNPYPNTVTTAKYNELLGIVTEMDDVLRLRYIEFLNGLENTYPQVWSKVRTWSIVEDQIDFMYDFENRIDELFELNTNSNLIDDWLEVVDELSQFRKDIKYLQSYNRFTQKYWEVKHITDFKNGSTTGGYDPIGAHAYKNISNNTIRNPNLPAPPQKPATTIFQQKNGHILYKDMYFIRPDGTLKKKSYQTIFNPTWDDLRIKGEMALAFQNKRLIKPTVNTGINIPGYSPPPQLKSVYHGFMSDGTKVEMNIYNFAHDPITNTIKTDHLGFFQLILK